MSVDRVEGLREREKVDKPVYGSHSDAAHPLNDKNYSTMLPFYLTVAKGCSALSVNPPDSLFDSSLSPGTRNTHPQSSFSNQIDAAASKVRQKMCRLLTAL